MRRHNTVSINTFLEHNQGIWFLLTWKVKIPYNKSDFEWSWVLFNWLHSDLCNYVGKPSLNTLFIQWVKSNTIFPTTSICNI